jgi:hypothetical protein
MVSRFRSVLLFVVLIAAADVAAQEQRIVTLSPSDPARWDFVTQVGWFGGNKSEIAPDWNDWYDTAALEVAVGHYWTPHLKVELGVSTTAEARMLIEERVLLPTDGFPLIRSRDHRFRSTGVGAGLTYQFFENAWFHPFLGAGISLVHERQRAGVAQPLVFFGDPLTRVVPPAPEPFERDATDVRPFALLGFKAYVSERAFIRTDLRVTASRDHAETAAWSGGVGFDF